VDRNLLLAFALSFVVLSTWSMLQQKERDTRTPDAIEVTQGDTPPAQPEGPRYRELPAAEPELPTPTRPSNDLGEQAVAGELIAIEQPLYRARLDSRGAVIDHWELIEYADRFDDPIVLVDSEIDPDGAAATPLLELGLGDLSTQEWSVENADTDSVSFRFEKDGVRVDKRYYFESDTYLFRLLVEIKNASGNVISPRFLVDWPTRQRDGNDFREQSLAVLHEGSLEFQLLAGLGSPGFFGSMLGRSPVEVYEPYIGEVDWAGVQTPYFLSALLPDQPTQANARIVVLERAKSGAVELFFDPVEVPSGQSVAREFRGYVGPKEASRLEAIGGSAIASINMGWWWVAPLARVFNTLLDMLYAVIPNYGVAIILLTIMVRLVTAPLTIKQMRSMERMRQLQPRIKALQEKYADDKPKQSEEMMRLYKQEKVNPLGGCLPMLLQFPVFIGLYYALRSSIHLRHAPFFGWIDDLSAPDMLLELPGIGVPIRVLPLLNGLTMFVQQKITPMQADPAQARMMMIVMPIMMTVIFYQFPSGLVLYWMMSSVLAVTHQLLIGRKMQSK